MGVNGSATEIFTKLIKTLILKMEFPKDPNILFSIINMKLRDGDYESLSDLCASLGYDEQEVVSTLQKACFEYNGDIRQFR